MRRCFFSFALMLLLPAAAMAQDYLYQRDVTVPAYQTMREFFDMPNRAGHYEVTLVSEAVGPLTFKIIRVRGDQEHSLARKRSYHVGSHSVQQRFNNPQGEDDLMVEIANSNPAVESVVTVFVVELPN
ncbi:MAG: hypothetical protein R8K53_00055 [Mariprofundaceae bacterium]